MHTRAVLVCLVAVALSACTRAATGTSHSPIVAPSAANATPDLTAMATPLTSPTVSTEPGNAPDVQFLWIDGLTLSEDGRRIDLKYVGAKPFDRNDRCSADHSAWTEAVDGILEVGVWESRWPLGHPVACDAMGYGRTLRVDLEEPFTGTAWRDLAGPFHHFLAAPPGLVRFDLPDGWRLIAEKDVQESPTGRWQRTYALSPDAPYEQTLTVLQAFGSPANTTGGAEVRSVDVNGATATLYRHPPVGELVLVWQLDGDGLALVVNERWIPAEALIEMAKSAASTRDR
jgi:hypothetical protein